MAPRPALASSVWSAPSAAERAEVWESKLRVLRIPTPRSQERAQGLFGFGTPLGGAGTTSRGPWRFGGSRARTSSSQASGSRSLPEATDRIFFAPPVFFTTEMAPACFFFFCMMLWYSRYSVGLRGSQCLDSGSFLARCARRSVASGIFACILEGSAAWCQHGCCPEVSVLVNRAFRARMMMGLRHVATAEEETSMSFSSVCRFCLRLQTWAAGCRWG